MTELTLILNFVIIFLLITAMVYGFILNRRIKLIRESGRELSHLFRSFDDTILKAQSSVEDLKKVSKEVSDGLQKKIDKAILLMDDMEFLGEKANQATNRAGAAIASLKKFENKTSEFDKNKNIGAMPLVMSPPTANKTYIPEKPAGKIQNHKALEKLLEEVSMARKNIQTKNPDNLSNIKANVINASERAIANQDINNKENKNIEKKQFSIASALKAMGYGD